MGLPFFGKKIESKRNINLLPEEETATLSVKRDTIAALVIPVVTLILLVVAFAGFFLLETGQKVKHNDLTSKITQAKSDWQKLAGTAAAVNQINSNLKTYQTAAENNKTFHNDLVGISETVPATVVLSKIDLNIAGEATLNGTAPNPRDIYQFIEVLKKKSEIYSSVALKNISYNATDQTYTFSVSFIVAAR